MNTLSYKTISANVTTVNKEWLLVDAQDETLGRLASKVASLIRGKHKTNFTPHVDCGDNVVVINASKIKLSGKKWDQKDYVTFSGYPGGQKMTKAKDKMVKNPISMVEIAIKGMLPNNRLGNALYKNLHVYADGDHKQEAQNPKKIDLNTI